MNSVNSMNRVLKAKSDNPRLNFQLEKVTSLPIQGNFVFMNYVSHRKHVYENKREEESRELIPEEPHRRYQW